MSTLNVVGQSIPRLDGLAKVAGTAVFLADRDIPGTWYGGTVRADVPRGRIAGIDRDTAFDWSRATVLTARDLPAANAVHIVRDEYPILADDAVHYATQAVALVAAPDKQTLARALAAIRLRIEPLPPVLTIDEALAGHTVVWGTDNIVDAYRVDCGDSEAGFATADIVVEGVYTTGLQEQLYLEPQGVAAIPGPDGVMELTGSIQCPYYVQGAVAAALGLSPDRVRVTPTEVGGGFGGKEDYPSVLGVHAALLARKTGRPVTMRYDRTEDLHATPKRHPSRVVHRTGLRHDGTITAMEVDLVLNAGAYTTLSMVVLQRAVLHATGCYYTPHARIRGRAVATNTPPNGAFRGFGAPQALFAVERQMDKIARTLGIDPLDLRLMNALRSGMAFPYGQIAGRDTSACDVLTRAAERADYRRKRREYARIADESATRGDRFRRGIGISVALHGSGFTGAAEDTMRTTVRIVYRDGVFTLRTSSVDMGQGAATALPQIAAECLGIPIERVRHPRPDTDACPDSGPTVASRSTMFVGRVLYRACIALTERLHRFVARRQGAGEAAVSFAGGSFDTVSGARIGIVEAAELYLREHGTLEETVELPDDGAPKWDAENFRGDAYKGYGWIAQAIEVEVDMDTYEATPLHATVVAEVGRAVNPALATGQIEGGALQGCGWSHLESLEITERGAYTAGHLNEYLVPTTIDTPVWDTVLLEVPGEVGPYGVKGIGELPINGAAPAFLAAVENATGVAADDIPLTGERLWATLNRQEGTQA